MDFIFIPSFFPLYILTKHTSPFFHRPEEYRDGFLVVYDNQNEKSILRVFAAFDMGWSGRGNGFTYDSLNGYCCIVGMKTGKILDNCTRNRKCATCESNPSTLHDCRLNFYGSAKSMEADGAVELVINSKILKEALVQVGVLIADNDSSSLSAIQSASDHVILKQSDMTHSTKGIGRNMYEIHNVNDPENELSHDAIKNIQKCFAYAVMQIKGKVQKIKDALENIPFHLFGYHDNCGEWCKDDTDTENKLRFRFRNSILFESLKKYFAQLDAIKFCSAASSQGNESVNHKMASKAPKSVSYSTSESADYRYSATVAQKNKGEDYLRMCMDSLDLPYNSELALQAEKSQKKLFKRREKILTYKRNRLEKKAARSQLRNRREQAESIMYSTNMDLLNSQSTSIENCIKIVENIHTYETDEYSVVFFDLETGGQKYEDNILQISMKSGVHVLNASITPTRSIAPDATKMNGLSICQNKLFQHGVSVQTFSRQMIFTKVLHF